MVDAMEEERVVASDSWARLRMNIYEESKLEGDLQKEIMESCLPEKMQLDLGMKPPRACSSPRSPAPPLSYHPVDLSDMNINQSPTMSPNNNRRTQKASFSTFNSVFGKPSLRLGEPHTVTSPSLSTINSSPKSIRRSSDKTVAREKLTTGAQVTDPA